jgi:hypothetical protein
VAFCYRLHGERDVGGLSDEEISEKLLAEKNTWMVQMYVDPVLQDKTKAQNFKFWTDVVTKSKNPNLKSFEGNTGTGKGYFNKNYYDTQAADQYPFARIVSGRLKVDPGMKSESQVIELIRDFK